MDVDVYCREIEAYLCQRNAGHLVRVSGPAFDRVRDWAAMGVPLKIVFQGIDRHLRRVEARGGSRRRPVRIEFCEADILDAFDAWRRAVGVRGAGDADAGNDESSASRSRRRHSLSAHIDHVIVRLTALRTGPSPSSGWDAALDRIVGQLDALHAASRNTRGSAREKVLAELSALDARLMEAAREAADEATAAAVAREADDELESFRGRLSADAYDAARRRCADRILRERLALPAVAAD